MTALLELPAEKARLTWSRGGWEYTGVAPGTAPTGTPGMRLHGPAVHERSGRSAVRPEPPAEPERTFFVAATDARAIEALPDVPIRHIANLRQANDASDLNALFRAVNAKLPVGGTYAGCVETCELVKRRHFAGRPAWRAWPGYALHFLFRRILPKLALTRGLYRCLSLGRGHALSKTEILGRLVYCGFDVTEHWEAEGELHFVVEKRGAANDGPPPPSGLLFRMQRVGQGGRLRYYYKLRTMHPYAEYLQASIYATNALAPNGKFKDDFRVTSWGRFMRRTWLDELPMVVNLLRGDLKLVGVRPLSRHYLSLYPPELLALRLRHKPGLIPPFYVDLPEGFDAICASEQRYLEAYERHPLRTDLRYLTLAVRRIVFEHARSQ